jgi:hypothetical protein
MKTIHTSKVFLSRTPTTQQLRERMDKWDFMNLKSFCTTKEMVCKLERSPTEWEKIFASYTSDNGLITRIYRELKKCNSPNKYSPSLAINEMQIKTILRFHLTSVRMAIIKNTTTTSKCW